MLLLSNCVFGLCVICCLLFAECYVDYVLCFVGFYITDVKGLGVLCFGVVLFVFVTSCLAILSLWRRLPGASGERFLNLQSLLGAPPGVSGSPRFPIHSATSPLGNRNSPIHLATSPLRNRISKLRGPAAWGRSP